MKKTLFLAGLLLMITVLSCSRESKINSVDLNVPWRFATGDDLAWAVPDFDDSKWDTITPGKIWENQGYKGYDGFAWYRIKVVIPSFIKDNAFIKDSIQVLMGKIDDCDQVFLNGELIGENGRTIYQKTSPADTFFKERGRWYIDRKYILASGDPRILWNKENVIAVRSFDQGGAGGMFAKPYEISMVDLKDHIKFDFTNSSFTFEGDTQISKKFIIQNLSGSEIFKGILQISVRDNEKGNIIFSQKTELVLQKLMKNEMSVSVKKDISKPAIIDFTFTESASGKSFSESFELPYILTPKTPREPRINGAKIFGVRPWSPFLFKVAATGEKPLKYSATGMPEGLRLDSGTGIIKGALSKKGEYIVRLQVENSFGQADRELKIVVGDKISLTPPLGWNSWNCWGLSVSDKKVRQSADAMKASGLIDHGWTYINIDDGWEDKHDKDGKILTNYKFPNMFGLCDYVHSLGLKIGIYSSPGPKTCGGYEGSYTFEEKDAKAYANWGIDYLKYDWCSYYNIAPKPTMQQMKFPYKEMKRAIRKVNRDIHYSLCQYGMGNVWEWGAEVDGNSWRTTGDIEDTWESMSEIGFGQNKCSPFAEPGRWNDPDMLVVGWVGWGPALHYTRLTTEEQYTHISLWCLLASPLLIGCDLEQMDAFTFNLLSNDEVLAVNQDPLGKQAVQVKFNESYQIWAKDMEDGSKVVGLFNLTENPLYIPLDLKDLSLKERCNLRDLWRQADLGKVETHFEMKVLPHGVALLKIAK